MARLKSFSRFFSAREASSPISATLTTKSGFPVASAIVSAVSYTWGQLARITEMNLGPPYRLTHSWGTCSPIALASELRLPCGQGYYAPWRSNTSPLPFSFTMSFTCRDRLPVFVSIWLIS